MDRRQLAEFLQSRRARVQPGDVGLAAGIRRRTPGLRREGVARLAGISVDYYTRLEQARGPRPSRQVLSALARALRVCVRRGSTTKQVRHPVVGDLTLECEVLDVAGHGQRLIIYTAAPGSSSAESLKLLAVVGTQWTADDLT
jgi:hypothetical protein